MTTDAIAIREYINLVYPASDKDYIALVYRSEAKNRIRHTVVPANETERIIHLLETQPEGEHIYVSVAYHDEDARTRQTRTNDTATALNFIALDVDLDNGKHAADNYPETEDKALELLRDSGVPEPSLIIHSGGGLYPVWLLDQRFEIETPENRDRVSQIWVGFEARVREYFDSKGYRLDKISDLARILRVPGTLNIKTDPARLVRLYRPDNGKRFSISELAKYVPQTPKAASGQGSKSKGRSALKTTLNSEIYGTEIPSDGDVKQNKREADKKRVAASSALAIIEGCAFIEHCVENAENLTEPEWKDAADIFAHIDEGDRYFHLLSSADLRYDETQTQEKLDRAREYGPKLCETIAGANSACEGCIFRCSGAFRSPVALKASEPGLAGLQRRYVLESKTGLFYDYQTGQLLSWKDFERHYTRDMVRKLSASTTLQNSAVSVIAKELDYRPGDATKFEVVNDHLFMNTWQPGGVEAKAGDASLWINHIAYLIPDERERHWFTQYLAHLVQHPSRKIRSIPLIKSLPGVGKNIMVTALKRMFHENDVRELYGGVLADRWKSDMGNCLLLVLDELQVDELKNAYNALKRWATEETGKVERKGIDSYDVRTPRGMLIFSNHDVPIKADEGDRRLFVVRVDAAPREREYYKRLSAEGMSDTVIAAFKAYLLAYDLSDFDPNERPPMTKAKEDLIAASRPIPEQLLIEMRDAGHFPFNKPIYVAEDVATALGDRMKRTITTQSVTPILEKLGDKKIHGKPTLKRGPLGTRKQVHVWVWQNLEFWTETATNKDVQVEFERPITVSSEGLTTFLAAHLSPPSQLAN